MGGQARAFTVRGIAKINSNLCSADFSTFTTTKIDVSPWESIRYSSGVQKEPDFKMPHEVIFEPKISIFP